MGLALIVYSYNLMQPVPFSSRTGQSIWNIFSKQWQVTKGMLKHSNRAVTCYLCYRMPEDWFMCKRQRQDFRRAVCSLLT